MWIPIDTNHLPNNLADQIHPLMAPAHLNDIGPAVGQSRLSYHDNCFETALKCDNELKASTWPHNAPHLILIQLHGCLTNKNKNPERVGGTRGSHHLKQYFVGFYKL